MNQELEDLHARVYPVQKELLRAYRASKIPREMYHKSLIQLAYEYAAAGYGDETLTLVLQVPPEYFRTASTTQMEEDPTFFGQAKLVAETLRAVGLLPTQRVARA